MSSILRPPVSAGSWIRVGELNCVVSAVFEVGNPFGDCEVVFNPTNPSSDNVRWDGKQWLFVAAPDYGGYGDAPRLKRYVEILKRGI
ncbi:hypothetical protein ACYCFK_17725 [Stutzerimonas stutzeri]